LPSDSISPLEQEQRVGPKIGQPDLDFAEGLSRIERNANGRAGNGNNGQRGFWAAWDCDRDACAPTKSSTSQSQANLTDQFL
jgi:hypothetical protein